MLKTLVLFIVMLSLIIIIHEGGHFLAAKIFGVYCEEFSIGMGPKIFSKKGKETTYSIRALPLGGFVAMAGDKENELETTVTKEVPFERTLNGIKPIKRIIIMMAGIVMNFVLAIVVMAIVFMLLGKTSESPKAIIADIRSDYPADLVGLKKDDLITKASFDNGYSISPNSFGELSDFLSIYDGNGNIHLTVRRGEETLRFDVKPVKSEEGNYVIGISSYEYEVVETNFFNSWKYSFIYLNEVVKLTLMTLIGLFRGVGLENLSGPVGVYQATQDAVSYGYISYFALIAVISVNVGLFNAIPLPIFDGGRVVLLAIEMIRKKPLSKEVENKIMSISIALLFMLIMFVTFKDIFSIFRR